MAKLCPSCGNDLNTEAYCDSCNKHIHIYKRIADTSKILYNEGLELAKVRDITNAIGVLNRSLKMDKSNVDARNLLGLLYFEIGETVSALSHWVLSRHMQPENNIADKYIGTIQENQVHLERLNSATKKYNQALSYIKQGSVDLAVIQLKKVLSLNPKFVNAYNLLALCYVQEDQNEKAIKTLKKVLQIDKSNQIARKYFSELSGKSPVADTEEKKESDGTSFLERFPINFSLSNSIQQLLALGVGVVVGVLVVSFLIMPKQIDEKNSEISTLESELSTLTASYNSTEAELAKEKESASTYMAKSAELETSLVQNEALLDETTKVLLALNYYVGGDKETAANELYIVDTEILKDSGIFSIYETAVASIFPEIAEESYRTGKNYYLNYGASYRGEAIELLETSIKFATDQTYSDDAYYYLAACYRKEEDFALARKYYKVVIDEYPESDLVENAKWWYSEIENN